MPAINVGTPTRFDLGGSIELGSGNVVNNVVPGSLEIEVGGTSLSEYRDLGVPQVPTQGDRNYSTIRFRIRVSPGDIGGANPEIPLSSHDMDSATGKPKTFSVIIKVPNFPYATTGITETFANSYYARPVTYTSRDGDGHDEFSVEIRSATVTPAYSTY